MLQTSRPKIQEEKEKATETRPLDGEAMKNELEILKQRNAALIATLTRMRDESPAQSYYWLLANDAITANGCSDV